MSTTGTSAHTELAQDVLNLVEVLRGHVVRLAGSSTELAKVKIYNRTIRKTVFITISKNLRLTRYGLVPRRAGWRTAEPILHIDYDRIPTMVLVDIRRTLLGLAQKASSRTMYSGDQ